MTNDANRYHCRIYHERPIRILMVMNYGALPGLQGEELDRGWAIVSHLMGG